jgi:TRAP-type C4-dicarboxylate transport system substrate-binding protein
LKKLGIALLLVICMSLIAIGCPQPAAPELITARFSGWAPPPSIPGQAEVYFFERLHEKVGDRIEVEVFQGGTLYQYQEAQIPLKTGAVEIIDFATIEYYEWVPEFKVVFLTGAWDVDELMTFLSSPDCKPAWDKMLEVSNCIPLGPHPAGTFFLWSSEPISSTADFQGLRVESGNFEQIDIVKALGGSGGALQVYDIYTALQQGQYDAAIGTPSIVLGFGWAEFTNYVGTHPWTSNINHFLVNKDFWDSLPQDVQDAFKESAEETTAWVLDMADKAEAGQLAALEEQWGIEYFTISDWEKVIATAQTEVWPDIRAEVGPEFFDTAMEYAGLAD